MHNGLHNHNLTLSRPDIVKQFPGPSLPKLMAQFCFAFRFSYWCMLSPQPFTKTRVGKFLKYSKGAVTFFKNFEKKLRENF